MAASCPLLHCVGARMAVQPRRLPARETFVCLAETLCMLQARKSQLLKVREVQARQALEAEARPESKRWIDPALIETYVQCVLATAQLLRLLTVSAACACLLSMEHAKCMQAYPRLLA